MAEKKITVEKASRVADVSKSNIVSWRSGVAPTNFEAVKKLAELFGVSFSFLLTGAEESSSDKKEDHLITKRVKIQSKQELIDN